MIPEHLIYPASLSKILPPSATSTTSSNNCLSILSHNILLPNSVDAWWTYKMYDPSTLPSSSSDYTSNNNNNNDIVDNSDIVDITSWDYRRALISEKVKTMEPDVVCFQEVSPTSFEDDFRFMSDELGYDGVALYKKGRFRPATFWKTNDWTLVSPEVHKDRSLLTAFVRSTTSSHQDEDDDGNGNETTVDQQQKQQKQQQTTKNDNDQDPKQEKSQPWFVANCHLQAGKNGPRRVRQIQEAIKGVLTLARKLKVPKPEENARLIVCGDFNGGPEAGAVRYLEDGYVDESWLEDNEPVTSSRKDLPMSQPLVDVSTTVVSKEETTPTTSSKGPRRSSPPPTMVVQEIMSSLMDDVTYQQTELCQPMKDRLQRIYKRFATGENGQMTTSDVERWLTTINKRLCRGDEYRNAALEMGFVDPIQDENETSWEERKKRIRLPTDGTLTLDGFINVYQKELDGGKFWGIKHDMYVLGDPMEDKGLFTARYDRIYFNSQSIQPVCVVDTLSTKPCPNDVEPSDHLPVAATFQSIP